MLSLPHLVIIFLVALIVFGPEKLPELARNFGKVMAEFRRATGDLRAGFEEHMRELERETRIAETVKQQATPPARQPPAESATQAGTLPAPQPPASNAAPDSANAAPSVVQTVEPENPALAPAAPAEPHSISEAIGPVSTPQPDSEKASDGHT